MISEVLLKFIVSVIVGSSCMWVLSLVLRCAHFWELVDKTEFEPPIKIYMEVGGSRHHLGYLDESTVRDMSKKTVLIVLRCTKCGKSKLEKVSA